MDNLGYVKGTLFAGLLITVNQGWAANATAPVKVSNYIIPSVFAKESANKQVISSQADSLIKISRIWADFFPANTSNQPI